MPPHTLNLKIGAPIMVLRSMDPPKICNGTRCIVTRLSPNVIEARVAVGPYTGTQVFIPRIPLCPSDTDIPFQMRRVQFPVKLCFAMTITKAQGQTLKVVGLNLDSPCFSHGQFYTGCSRTGSPNGLFIFVKDNSTRNVVYHEALSS